MGKKPQSKHVEVKTFEDFLRLKAARKRQDEEDLASGRRTAEEIQRENDVFGFSRGTKIISIH